MHRPPRSELVSSLIIAGVLTAGIVVPRSSRSLQLLVLCGLLVGLGITGHRIARFLLSGSNLFTRCTAAFSVAVAVAAIPAIALGHFGRLRPAPFLMAVIGLCLASTLLPVESGSRRPSEEDEITDIAEEDILHGRLKRMEAVLLVVAAVAIVVLPLMKAGLESFYLAPGHSSFDETSYHLTAVATWHQHEDLRMMKFAMGGSVPTFFPVVAEITAWSLLAPFGDSDVAARWAELPFALFSLVALVAIGRRIGLSTRSAAFAALLYASIHRFFPELALVAGNDHATAFFTLAALDGLLEVVERPRFGSVALAGLASGLLVGTKYIGVIYAVTLLVLVALVWLVRRPRLAGTKVLGLLTLFSVTATIAGGYTYLRNFFATGNPIFPTPIDLLGWDGWRSATLSFRKNFPEYRIDVVSFLTRRPDLFGPLFPLTLLPASLIAPGAALLRKGRWEGRIQSALILVLPLVLFLEFLYLMHDHRDVRYFGAGIALSAGAFAWITERCGRGRGLAIRVFVLSTTTFIVVARVLTTAWAVTGVLILLASILVAFRWRRPIPLPRVGPVAVAMLILLVAGAIPAGAAVERYQKEKLRGRPAPYALERLVGSAGAPVAYAGWNQPYLFFGSRLQNDTQFVPYVSDLTDQYFAWGGSSFLPFPKDGHYKVWRQNLERLQIKFVVLFLCCQNPERAWIAQNPGDFRLVFQDAHSQIWAVM